MEADSFEDFALESTLVHMAMFTEKYCTIMGYKQWQKSATIKGRIRDNLVPEIGLLILRKIYCRLSVSFPSTVLSHLLKTIILLILFVLDIAVSVSNFK
jgi:hypothetical protein